MKTWLAGLVGLIFCGGALAQTTVSVGSTGTSSGGQAHTVTTTARTNKVVLSKAGNLYSVGVTVGATPGFLLVHDATSAPADGTVTPVLCLAAPASTTTYYRWSPGPALRVVNGATIVFSTGATCFSQTAANAFLWGSGSPAQ